MHRVIQSILALLLAATSCGLAPAQTKEISGRDYVVLSDFLRAQLEGKNGPDDIRVGLKGSVVAPFTVAFLKPLDTELRAWMKRDLKGLTPDTLESFERCAAEQMVIRHRFDLPLEYELALPEETKDGKLLYAHHPHTNGFVQFSCLGVNSSGTQALFYLERLISDAAVGKWVLMEKDQSGKWVAKHELVTWIA
jgi:hypothetical protein